MARVRDPSRREVLAGLAAMAAGACGPRPVGRGAAGRPGPPLAVGSGDLDADRAVLWARAAGPGRLLVEVWGPGDRDPRRVTGPQVDVGSDLCGSIPIAGLGVGEHRYAISIEDARGRRGDATRGRLRVRGADEPFTLAWSGDVCGQGFGIDEARGGLAALAAVHALGPDVFLHSGDAVYADGPLQPEFRLPDGTIWRNRMTPAKAHVAVTQDDFWGNHAYNLLDPSWRALLAEVPVIAQWDDHETVNNWYPGEVLDDDRYAERGADVLAARARRAFLDYFAIRRPPTGLGADRIHRLLHPHPALDVIVLDARSFRGANSLGLEATASGATAMLGEAQARWLVDTLAASRARWKIVACDQPLGLVIPDGDDGQQEGFAQGEPGPPRGREHEVAAILAGVRARGVDGVVWLTADVHYAAAHRYDPARAAFTDFTPFWELVAGPLHAGVFGPQPLDGTFGPEVVFARAPPPARYGTGPASGLMSFGALRLQPRTGALVASLHGGDGATLWDLELTP